MKVISTQKGKVSILINCKNGQDYLKEAIESVYSQTYKNFEIIFVDNNSVDDTGRLFKDVMRKTDRYINAQCDLSLAEARNLGISQCRGEFIAFLDIDDIWTKDKLEKQVAVLKEHPEISLVYSNMSVETYPQRKDKGMYSKRSEKGVVPLSSLFDSYDVCFSSVIVRVDTEQVDSMLMNTTLEVCEDVDLVAKTGARGGIFFLDDNVGAYRLHGLSLSWRHPELFMNDLELLDSCYGRDMDFSSMKQTALLMCAIVAWRNGNGSSARSQIRLMQKRGIKILGLYTSTFFGYRFIYPLASLFGIKLPSIS